MFSKWYQPLRHDSEAFLYQPPGDCHSVIPSDLAIYGSANMPETDGVTTGGAVDFTKRVDFSDVSPAGTLDVVSSSASDTATLCKYAVRDPTGAIQTPTINLTGTTPAVGAQSAERLLYALLSGAGSNGPSTPPSGTAAVGDVALFAHTRVITTHTAQGGANPTASAPALIQLQAGDGASVAAGQIVRILNNTPAGVQFQLRRIVATSGYGTDQVAVNRAWTTIPASGTTYEILQGMLFEISPNAVTCITRLFATVSADVPTGAQRIFYEKVFAVNNNTGISLTAAQLEVASETPTLPTGTLLDAALTNALNDGGTVTNRQTAPASGIGAFVTQPAFINVPAPGNLPSGAAPNSSGAQGVWLRLTLPAGAAAYKGAVDIRSQGTTT